MTANEAKERAGLIWGTDRVVHLFPQGSDWQITLNEARFSTPGTSWKAFERNFIYHQLDGNGHTTCHDDCEQLEAEKTKPAQVATMLVEAAFGVHSSGQGGIRHIPPIHVGVDLASARDRTVGTLATSSGIVREMTDDQLATCRRYLDDPGFHFLVDQMRVGIRNRLTTHDDIRKALDLAVLMEDLHAAEMTAREGDHAAANRA